MRRIVCPDVSETVIVDPPFGQPEVPFGSASSLQPPVIIVSDPQLPVNAPRTVSNVEPQVENSYVPALGAVNVNQAL